MLKILPLLGCSLIAACGTTTPIQPVSTSKSGFDGAVYSGKSVVLDEPTPGNESYRIYHKGASGFVPLHAVRSGVEEEADAHCERKGKAMHGLVETTSQPPYLPGNFPRVELVFECIDKPTAAGGSDKYQKLESLKKLLDNGTLTQQEFEQEKTKLLSQP